MFSIFSREKSDIKIKREILRGIYEGNLRIISKEEGVAFRQKPFVLNKFFMPLIISTIAVIAHGSYVANSFLSEKQLTAVVIKNKTLPPSSKSNPADFQAFIPNPDMSVSRTFWLEVKTIMIDPWRR